MKYCIHRNLHTDFNIFEENKLQARSYFIPFSNTKALLGSDYKRERYQSDRITMLSGEWDFAYFDRLSQIPTQFDTETAAFDRVTVPSTWQRTGYDQIAYINTRYPFPKKPPHIPADVAVGIYRKKVALPDQESHRVLTFLGVAGALAVYCNGQYIGYSEGSHNTAEFDLTPFARAGENEVVAVVYKWSNGTYLECQDMFRENGIFRDVYIVSHTKNYLSDFLFRPQKKQDGTYRLHISASGAFDNETSLRITAKGRDGVLFETTLLPQTETVIEPLTVLEWTAETPNLYEVTLSLTSKGTQCEAVRTYIGFKDVRINGKVFLFNGKAIKMKGVNHHDTHCTKGYAMSIEDMEQDVILMKEYNCNTVRTSHYPPDPAFLLLCDHYGLYTVDEADIETHGFYSVPGTYRPGRLSNDLKWASHYLDRVCRMYERDKNHPSVTMWSLGNESGGYKCQDVCYDFLKKANPEIPVHYEGVNRSKRWAYDVVSHMYATPDLMRRVLAGKAGKKYENKPFFQCEYAHAMGNGPGGLEEYMQLFYSSDQFMGGCIWEWADHSVYDENATYKWTYGGDHNEPIHDSNFCVDGLFYPDRRPSSGALEMKTVYRPIRAKWLGRHLLELWNTRSFRDSADLTISYTVLADGAPTESGVLDATLAPLERKTVSIDTKLLDSGNRDLFLNLVYTDKATGFEVAQEQLVISEAVLAKETQQPCAAIRMEKDNIWVTFEGGGALFNRKKGLVSYHKNKTEYLHAKPLDGQHGFVPHIYRGRLDNDQYLMIFWKILGLEEAKAKLVSCKMIKKGTDRSVRTVYHFVTRKLFLLAKATVDYRFDQNGKVKVSTKLTKICPLTAELPRFGVHAELPVEFETITYYGRGPEENYSDFKEHAPVGIYGTTVTAMAHKYIKPQDAGNRGDVRYSTVCGAGKTGLRFSATDTYLNFNANHYTLGQLIHAKHIEDLPDTDTTFVTIDGFQRGTGSGSCGPAPSKEHRLAFGYFQPLSFSFEFNICGGTAT